MRPFLRKIVLYHDTRVLSFSAYLLFAVALIHTILFLTIPQNFSMGGAVNPNLLSDPLEPLFGRTESTRQYQVLLKQFKVNELAPYTPLATAFLSILLGVIGLNTKRKGFWSLFSLASLLALSGLLFLIGVQILLPGAFLLLPTLLEVSGWSLTIFGFLRERQTLGQYQIPIILREIGIFFLLMLSLLYLYFSFPRYFWVAILLFVISVPILVFHYARLARHISTLKTLEPITIKWENPFTLNNIWNVITTGIAIAALVVALRQTRSNEAAAYPIINTTSIRVITQTVKDASAETFLCRFVIDLTNTGGGGTSITDFDYSADIKELIPESNSEFTPKQMEYLTHFFPEKMVEEDARLFFITLSLRHSARGRQNSSSYEAPTEIIRDGYRKGLSVFHIWLSEPPPADSVLQFLSTFPVNLNGTDADIKKHFSEMFANKLPQNFPLGLNDGNFLPLFLPPQTPLTIYVDVITRPTYFFEAADKVYLSEGKASYTPPESGDGDSITRELQSSDLEINFLGRLKLSNHKDILLSNEGNPTKCLFEDVKFITP